MKVAVTTVGEDLEAQVDPRFGRAAKFILYDTESKEFTVIDNNAAVAAGQGAGVAAAQAVEEAAAEAVITGNCGPRAFQVLSAAGIRVYVGASGTVAEALRQFEQGKLKEAGGPNVQQHFGS
jgi:predicted Fe-Mo cluster-binding NifX family protein